MKADLSMMSSSNVFESSASYYNPATEKWETGHFTLNKSHVQFVIDSSTEDDKFHLCLPLMTVTGVEKRLSNFLYPFLVVCVGSEKHWFSSFPSRDAVYNLLELFWREALISKPHRKTSPLKACKSNTLLGKELLGLLNESKNTLIETANALSDQSRQLYDAEEGVEDLNSDLSKAEEALKYDSLLPVAMASKKDCNQDSTSAKTTEHPCHKYKVNYSFSNDENKTDWEKGILVIAGEVISLKVEEKTVMQITKDELEAFQVLSPWEFCISHVFSEVRKLCYFMCPQLSRLLKFVSSFPHYKEKISFTDDDSSAYDTASCYSSSSSASSVNSPSSSSTQLKKVTDSTQSQVSSTLLSDEEICELNTVLQNLQTLAAEVCKEQENQMERISTLAENMEKTELRIKKDDKLLKKKA